MPIAAMPALMFRLINKRLAFTCPTLSVYFPWTFNIKLFLGEWDILAKAQETGYVATKLPEPLCLEIEIKTYISILNKLLIVHC